MIPEHVLRLASIFFLSSFGLYKFVVLRWLIDAFLLSSMYGFCFKRNRYLKTGYGDFNGLNEYYYCICWFLFLILVWDYGIPNDVSGNSRIFCFFSTYSSSAVGTQSCIALQDTTDRCVILRET